MSEYHLAVVGAASLVGKEIVNCLEQRDFPLAELRLFDTEQSAGITIPYKGKEVSVKKLTENAFAGLDIVVFAATADISQKFAPLAVQAGAVVIDTTSAFRREPEVPLIIPEINPHVVASHKGIIASPSGATIPLAVVLRPIHMAARLRRVVVSTYQAVSVAGQEGIAELDRQVRHIFNHRDIVCQVFPHQIAFNCLPQIEAFLDNGYTQAEMNIIHETRKILGVADLRITATAVCVPVFYGYAEAVNIETEQNISPEEVTVMLEETQGVKVVDEPSNNVYPLTVETIGDDETVVGRIRADESLENGLNLWLVTDNLRKGAALNAVQIAEILIWGGDE